MHVNRRTQLTDPARVAALHASGLLAPIPDPEYARLTGLAAASLGVPIALIGVIAADRHVFLAPVGLPAPLAERGEVPLAHSLCRHVVERGAPLRLPDAARDPEFADHKSVTEFGVAAYLGVPLCAPGGEVLGALCGLDTHPRDWTDRQMALLQDLAAVATGQIAMGHLRRELPGLGLAVPDWQGSVAGVTRQAMRLQQVGGLAAGLVHDLRNVLHAVTANAELAGHRLATDGPAVARLLGAIQRAAERGASMTERVLRFARMEGAPEPAEPARLFARLGDLLEGTLRDYTLHFDCAHGLPPLRVDEAALEPVLVNLILNARDAMPHGGSLTLSARCATDPPGLPPGAYCRLEVADTGTGMDVATLSRVKEPFFTTKPAGQGTGLGMSAVAAFIHDAGGALDIASTLGEGTTVTLWLPMLPSA